MKQAPTPIAQATELRYAVLAMQREGNRRFAGKLSALRISPAQAEVLMILAAHGPTTLKNLGKLLICETGSPSRLVDGLVTRGFIHRAQDQLDRRKITLRLSRSGRAIQPLIGIAEAELEDSIQAVFSEPAMAEFSALIRAFLTGTSTGEALSARFADAGQQQANIGDKSEQLDPPIVGCA